MDSPHIDVMSRSLFQRRGSRVLPLLAVLSALPVACTDGMITPSGGSSPGGAPNTPPTSAPTGSGSWFESLKSADCSKEGALAPSRVWRLNAQQWKNSVEGALGVTGVDVARFPKDQIDPRTGFNNDAGDNRVTLSHATLFFDISGEVADKAAPGVLSAFACLGTAPLDGGCAEQVVSDYGKKLFRRPLTSGEVTAYATFLTGEAKLDPPSGAVASLLRTMLMSPSFLYRTELGNSKPGTVELTGHEIASLLSYSIADAPPDAMLLQAAESGQLNNPMARESHARRLMGTPAARAKLADFWRQYLGRSEIPVSEGIDAALATAIIKETEQFFDRVVWDKPGALSELLGASYTYADPPVATLYGAGKAGSDGRIELNPAQRRGLLTQASFLVGTATPSQAGTVIHRGLVVRERLLCLENPALPPDFVPDPKDIEKAGPDATARENYEVFARSMPACNACHSAFQPIGLAFETYDKLGRYRETAEGGKRVITTGELLGAGDASGPYQDVPDLATRIGKSQISQYCFSKQFAQYILGRGLDAEKEACTVRTIGDHVAGQGGAIRELFTAVAHVKTAYRRSHQ